jgi:hypothetical protein
MPCVEILSFPFSRAGGREGCLWIFGQKQYFTRLRKIGKMFLGMDREQGTIAEETT